MQIVPYLTNEASVLTFLLLIMRFAGVFAFFPFFENQLISPSIRGAMIFFMALIFFPIAHYNLGQITLIELMIAGLFELMLGFLAGLCLQIVFSMVSFSGEMISFSMGLTMASAYDPVSGTQKPIVAQLLSLLAILLALGLDFHHVVFMLVAHSLDSVPLGSFIFDGKSVGYFVKAFGNLFVVGFCMAFPILAIILFSDIIFGMIMKTHPQFNLLAIGFPVKIAIAFVVLIIAIPSIFTHFKSELNDALLAVSELLKL
ncbi:flagellar type III secretion system protein FliR [Helicobacter sp. MIT 00-7814]|uniref:flagellar biosynthetic protein FliR n=1 Tax=unclassified Helicobacter TaxID=2593540 RepID=UPI000E1F37A2|nr:MULTISPECIES: flagellar biosynthetic protein FliR [unclassified Helicobacter]RDU57121.1 flagellar type III secretion system protein FliR [Helicobacter sp. MIT 00-7814]RDU57672.1 flagellar type III secretion system protein FliR [Helicobacter sp. MIT 99-10781]